MSVEEYAAEYGITIAEAQAIFDEEEFWKRQDDIYEEDTYDEDYNGLSLAERNM